MDSKPSPSKFTDKLHISANFLTHEYRHMSFRREDSIHLKQSPSEMRSIAVNSFKLSYWQHPLTLLRMDETSHKASQIGHAKQKTLQCLLFSTIILQQFLFITVQGKTLCFSSHSKNVVVMVTDHKFSAQSIKMLEFN